MGANKAADISVIIPAYNAEKTIAKCIDSVIGQTKENIEIICVNDGSADGTYEILKSYADRDNRVHIINKHQNEGLVAARKTGVNKAGGRYIGFVDADDWIEAQMFEKLYAYAVDFGADIISSGYILEGSYISVCKDAVKEGFYRDNILKLRNNTIYNMKSHEPGLRGALWCKLFKREIIDLALQKLSTTLTYSEDKLCLIGAILESDSVYITHECFYHYIIYPNSMAHGSDLNYLERVNDVYKQFNTFYLHPNFTDEMRLQAEVYMTELLYKGINVRLGFKNKNLLWIDPYWLAELPVNSRIVLYGKGELLETYEKQLKSSGRFVHAANVDYSSDVNISENKNPSVIYSPRVLEHFDYDYCIVTIKNQKSADEVIERLIADKIPRDKIKWFDQTEIFWRFVTSYRSSLK